MRSRKSIQLRPYARREPRATGWIPILLACLAAMIGPAARSTSAPISEPVESHIDPSSLEITSVDEVPEVVRFDLGGGVVVDAMRSHVDFHGPGLYTWRGETANGASAIAVIHGARMTANVYTDDGTFAIRPGPRSTHTVHRVEAFSEPVTRSEPVDTPDGSNASTARAVEAWPIRSGAGDDTNVDVLAFYTPAAAAAVTDIESTIRLSIAEANWTFANSDLDLRLRLIAVHEIEYTESSDTSLEVDLDHLFEPHDGCMDEAHYLRELHRADLVSLWIEGNPSAGFSGLAKRYDSDGSRGFHVLEVSAATGSGFVFAHEVGHNMGAHHDWWKIGCGLTNIEDHSRGTVNIGESGAASWRTVMAYGDQCAQSTPTISCPRRPLWSSPNLVFDGSPTGFDRGTAVDCSQVPYEDNPDAFPSEGPPGPADNAGTLADNRAIVANFRRAGSPGPYTFVYRLRTLGEPATARGCRRELPGARYRATPDNTSIFVPTLRFEVETLGVNGFPIAGDVRVLADGAPLGLYADPDVSVPIGDRIDYSAGDDDLVFWVAGNFSDGVEIRLEHTQSGAAPRVLRWILDVLDLPSAPDARLDVSPTTPFNVSGPVDGPFEPLEAEYVLANQGGVDLRYEIEVDYLDSALPWLESSLGGGTLTAGASRDLILTVDDVVEGFETGIYRANVHIANLDNAHDDTTRRVELNVRSVSSGSSGLILAPNGDVSGNVTVRASAADSDGLDTVAVRFVPSGPRLILCGPGCDRTSGIFTASDIDPAAFGATPGTLDLELDVTDDLGNVTTVDQHAIVWSTAIPGAVTLTLEKQGDGRGSISVEPVGFVCDPDCPEAEVSVAGGTTLTINATPESGSTFVGFAGDVCFGPAECTLPMPVDRVLYVSFGLPEAFQVTGTVPADGDTNASTGNNPRVLFSREIEAGPRFSSIALTGDDDVEVPSVSVVPSGRRSLVINPQGTLDEGTRYTVSIPADAVVDLEGSPLPAPFQFQFTTRSLGTPQIFVAAYRPVVQEGDESLVDIYFDRTMPFDRDIDITSTTVPGGHRLFHPSIVTVPADTIGVRVEADSSTDPGSLADARGTLQVSESGAGTASTVIAISNRDSLFGSTFKHLATTIAEDEPSDGDGICEAGEICRVTVETRNFGPSTITVHRVEMSPVRIAPGFIDFLGGDDNACTNFTLPSNGNHSCERRFRVDEDTPGERYEMKIEGASSADGFLTYRTFTIVNNAPTDYKLTRGGTDTVVLDPNEIDSFQFTATKIGDGFDASMPLVRLERESDTGTITVLETYFEIRGGTLGTKSETRNLPIEAPSAPGTYTFRATINPDQTIAESSFLDNQAEAITVIVPTPNRPPVLGPIPTPITIDAGQTLTIQATANDPDEGDSLTFSLRNDLDGVPDGMSIDPDSGLIIWTPTDDQGPRLYSVEVVVEDDHPFDPLEDSQTVAIDVLRRTDLAVSIDASEPSVLPGETFSLTVTVRNLGPGNAQGIGVSTDGSETLIPIGWQCLEVIGGTCTPNGELHLSEIDLDLDSGGVATYRVDARAAVDASGIVNADAAIQTPVPLDEISPEDNTARTAITVRDLDFGDAPDATVASSFSYPTRLVDDGARHGIDPTLLLGSFDDGDDDGQPHVQALGDDLAASDDEDGVTWPSPIIPCTQATVRIEAIGTGVVDAWIDFDGNGDWMAPSDRVLTAFPVTTGMNEATFGVPCGLSVGTTFARVRLSSQGIDTPTGLAADGEVEDMMLIIEPRADLVIEKTSTTTMASAGQEIEYTIIVTNRGPGTSETIQILDPPPSDLTDLGWTCEATDGSACGAGQDGPIDDLARVVAGGQLTYTLRAVVGAQATGTVSNTATVVPNSGIVDLVPENNTSTHSFDVIGFDFGDAPDTTAGSMWRYPTRLSEDGARHAVVPGPWFGIEVDSEPDGQPTSAADGDDLDATDDEDGVVIPTPLTACQVNDIQIDVSSPGKLDAWIDFAGDGDWSAPIDRIASSRSVPAGPSTIQVEVPCWATGTTYARFRISTQGGLEPTGVAADGEVEDHPTSFTTPDHVIFADGFESGELSAWEQ